MSHYQGILLWTEVVCSGCKATTAGEYVRHGRRQMRMVMAEIEKDGWANFNGDAYCPNCHDQYGPIMAAKPVYADLTLPTPFKGAK